ncbi:MAG: OprO/OprP family phosphate-selective porin [Planctomycetia bacterium]
MFHFRPPGGWRIGALLLIAVAFSPVDGAARAPVPRVAVDEAGDAEITLPDAAGVAAELESLQQQIDDLKAAAKKQAAARVKEKPKEKKPTLTISGQVQGDQVFFGQDAASRAAVGDLQDGAQFRRLRVMARGNATEQLEYALGVDFALANQPAFIDNYIEAHDLGWLQNVRFGHFFEPFSLERVTQNRNNTFMERSLVDTFAPARNMGVMAYGTANDDFNTWQIGTFRTNSDNIGNDSFDSGQALTMRGTWLPWWDEETDGAIYLHLGCAYSYRATSQNQVRFRNTPEIRKQQPANVYGPIGLPNPSNYQNGVPSPFAPIFVDTGNIPASQFQLFDPEFALILGPLSLQSEYAFAVVDQINGPNLFFNGYMAQVSYFLTGEHRPYDRKQGIHKRLEPYADFFCTGRHGSRKRTGIGAWEIAARYSNIVLNDKNISGNNLTDFTIGLNWYLTPYVRAKFNYIRAFLEDRKAGNSLTDAYGVRFDYDF